jgi:hypothetical protein
MIQRYSESYYEAFEDADGDYVKHDDHISSHSFDEKRERVLARAAWELWKSSSHFEPVPFGDFWAGWKACALSRASIWSGNTDSAN